MHRPSLYRSLARSLTHRTRKRFSCVCLRAVISGGICATVTLYVPICCTGCTRNVYNSTSSPRFCIRTELECTCTRVHAYVSKGIRRAYVWAHAKKRSCSIAGVSTFRSALQRVSRIPRVFINRQITGLNPTSIDPIPITKGFSTLPFFDFYQVERDKMNCFLR